MNQSPLRHTAYLALGSNLGDRFSHLERALERLSCEALQVVAESSIFESKALVALEIPLEAGALAQQKKDPDYLNCVIKVITSLRPNELLDRCLQIEWELGRVRQRALRWQPRTIDIDILLYDQVMCKTDRLTVPHPELHNRDFVLTPLLEVYPDFVHPTIGLSGLHLLKGLAASHILTKVGSFSPRLAEGFK